MHRLLVGIVLLIVAFGAKAAEPSLVISTNNTPQDRKALALLAGEAFRRTGLEFKLVNYPSERSLVMADQGDVDGEGLRVAGLTAQYPNLIQVPERFIGVSFVAFSKNALINVDDGWESLKKYRIAFIVGWKMFEANAMGAKSVTKVERPEQMFKMLEMDRVDVVLYTRADGESLLRSQNIKNISALSPALKNVDMYLYLNKRHEKVIPGIVQSLREMKEDGVYNKLVAEARAD